MRDQKQCDVLLAGIRKSLDSFTEKRSKDQKKFHESMLNAVIPKLYGNSLSTELQRILTTNHWDDLHKVMMIMTPRRWGKTFSVAMFVACYAYWVPNSEQCVFSTSRRCSQKILELIANFLHRMEGATERVLRQNVETIWLRGEHPKDIRKIYCYPSKVQAACILSCLCTFYLYLVYSTYGAARARHTRIDCCVCLNQIV